MKATEIAAIDIGTSKVRTLMGAIDGTSGLRILGAGIAPSQGMEKGLVADAAGVEESIRQSVKSAETMAGCKLASAYISLTGRYINSMNRQSTVAITHRNQMVHNDDINRALEIALGTSFPAGRRLLQVIPRTYTLDDNQVQEPVGMHGYTLKVEVHLITADVSPIQNLTQCVRKTGIKIDDLIPGSWASAEAVLSEEEKQSGILLADIGVGETDIVVMKNGSPYYTSVIPIAGYLITHDIALGLGLSVDAAEDIKKKYGCVQFSESKNDGITVNKNGTTVSNQKLCQIIQARIEGLIYRIMLELEVSELTQTKFAALIPSGMVITGGGANMPGINELGKEITGLPARTGKPAKLSGISDSKLDDPSWATSIGLLLWQIKNNRTLRGWSRSSRIHSFTI